MEQPFGQMMPVQTVDYYRRRELAERVAAQSASCEEARRAHVEMAEKYAALIRSQP